MGSIIIFIIISTVFYYIFKSYARYTVYTQQTYKNFVVTKGALQNSELGLFVALVAKVAKADGRVDALEAELVGIMFDDIAAIFPESAKTKEILKEIFNEEKDRTDNLYIVAQTLADALKKDKQKQYHFMGFLIQLAFIDGEVSKSEEDILSTIAEIFRIDPKVYHGIFDQFEKMSQRAQPKENIEDAYKLLGVSRTDDINTIKKAYRALVRQYHPDIIKSQDKDDTYLQEATQKTQEINRAYEMIKADKK
ncbi:MAG: TerB family tellurite resistance protein [Sulfurimonadaceae bacterium]|jgi:DnaJ like chaperone protein|nr:TerB family tellurite resistance protein [Sulfurimonadaceae bacterium]